MSVLTEYRGRGISTKMRDAFYKWLKEQDVHFCKLAVKVKNQEAFEIYKKWGFEVDEYRMWKKI
jgi:ribosomal protein S18 acetylase RimI-like enzyme